MLELEGLNYWAVLVAWLINIGVGAFWYSPAGFGKQWTKHTGVDHMKMPENEATKTIAFIALSALLQVFVLGVVLNSLNVTTVANALTVGVTLWLGLTAATTVGNTLYQRLGWKFLWLNSSYFLLVMAVNSVIFAIWQ
jgi:putative Mn2+ efflux pump MntP